MKTVLAGLLIVSGFLIVGPLLSSAPADQELVQSIMTLLLGLTAIVVGGYYFFGYPSRSNRRRK